LLRRAIRIEIDLISGTKKSVSGRQTADSGTDDGNRSHVFLMYARSYVNGVKERERFRDSRNSGCYPRRL
jgi:hypothetical protein